MPNFGSLIKMMQYAPMIFEFFRAVMPAEPAPRRHDEVMAELAHFQRSMENRIADMEEEIARLRARVREAEAQATSLQVALYIGIPVIAAVAILALVLAIVL